VEFHNEPNLTVEGLAMKQYSGSWHDGASYADWLVELIGLFKQDYPNVRVGLSALSPGHEDQYHNKVQGHGWRMDEEQFLNGMIGRGISDHVDFVCVHAYYKDAPDVEKALAHVRKYRTRFPSKPIAVTEHCYKNHALDAAGKGALVKQFVQGLDKIPNIMSSAFFIVSGADWDTVLRDENGASTGILEAWRS
jgi:hypothetical protein